MVLLNHELFASQLWHAILLDLRMFLIFGAGFFVHKLLTEKGPVARESGIIRQVLEGSRGARFVTDGVDRVVYSNQKFDELCGKQTTESLADFTGFFAGNEEALAHFGALADQAHRGLTDTIKLQLRRNDRDLWLEITAQPVPGWAGYIHWRVDDITDMIENERLIREEREKLIDFTDNAPVGFYSTDEDGKLLFVNATFARWVGENINTILKFGRLHNYLAEPPKDAAPYDILPQGGPRQMGEIKLKGPFGRVFTASVSQSVVQEPSGRVRTRGVVHDLTSERAMRMALQASEDKFQHFFEEAPLGIAFVDGKRVLQDCNKALAVMLGGKPSDFEGNLLDDLLEAEDLPKISQLLLSPDAPAEVTLKGKTHNVAVRVFAKHSPETTNTVFHFLDLSQQKALEERFAQSQKMQAVGQLAGGVAHDFNNLLTAIIGFCDLLLLRHRPGDPSFADIMQIQQNSNRAANLVRQLLAFSRQQTLRPQVHDMTDVITEVSHLVRRLIGTNIKLEMLHGIDLGFVKVDVGQMEQVIVNLSVNARDAMEGQTDAQLTIETTRFTNNEKLRRGAEDMPAGDWVVIKVSDTGCGIPPENMDRILEPFFTTKEIGKGTGLGLATVYGIIRQTGGYLHIESKVGEGTSFLIYLPRLSEEEAVTQKSEERSENNAPADLTGSAKILLVEDEDAVRTFSTRALTNKGYEVLGADSGESALQLLESEGDPHIDLVITDVMMPNMDGPTMVKHLRAKKPTLKIIFVSGYSEDRLKEHMGEGIYFLPKPFTLKQLAAKVKEVLE
ncbi:MAG: response regulator [Alphaproteobacteria bacterium]|nr:response regulator [Alphaproteobacteria bacterium]